MSAGVYGSEAITMSMNMYPKGELEKLCEDGETLDKAKAQEDDVSPYTLPAWCIDPNLDDLTPAKLLETPTPNDC